MHQPTLWEIALPVVIGAIVGLLFLPLVEVLKLWLSRRSWEAQERWQLERGIIIPPANGVARTVTPPGVGKGASGAR